MLRFKGMLLPGLNAAWASSKPIRWSCPYTLALPVSESTAPTGKPAFKFTGALLFVVLQLASSPSTNNHLGNACKTFTEGIAKGVNITQQ
jgi:hypothetical protein